MAGGFFSLLLYIFNKLKNAIEIVHIHEYRVDFFLLSNATDEQNELENMWLWMVCVCDQKEGGGDTKERKEGGSIEQNLSVSIAS